ncbi:MAG: hypothetical protein A3C53_08910 [Omnitrophica WOR_2 bacterium RIFCSPHIGHO2_02_FULL_68_15]|nr:MAG: hypothetical protein A3C53_08910 [Omnitrophica WOR_2 bacterium RIFCSPHIGHO2_02_FULL_68_15]
MKPIRVLAFTPIPEEGAGARFRLYQYIPALEASGFKVTVQPFFTDHFFRIIYRTGLGGLKIKFFIKQTLARMQQLLHRTEYDVFLVYREAFPIGPPLIEFVLSRTGGRPLIYDFDDAIYLPNASDVNQFIGVLKYPQKVPAIIRTSTHVIAGNPNLADYARMHNEWVSMIPTCVDTTRFAPLPQHRGAGRSLLRVGWIGSHSTVKYLRSLLPVLTQVARQHPFLLYVVGSPTPLRADGLTIVQAPWELVREIADFQSCDIGVYPMWNDVWAQGKCGFKAIQFMACGVPVVASAVGVNREIIQDGVNGFLAETHDEWTRKLIRLLSDRELCQQFAEAGRRTVEERYALAVNAPKMIAVLRGAIRRIRDQSPAITADLSSPGTSAPGEPSIPRGRGSHRETP